MGKEEVVKGSRKEETLAYRLGDLNLTLNPAFPLCQIKRKFSQINLFVCMEKKRIVD